MITKNLILFLYLKILNIHIWILSIFYLSLHTKTQKKMKYFPTLDLTKLLFISIETANKLEVLQFETTTYELYKHKLRNEESTLDFDFINNHYEKNAAILPEYNRIISITMGGLALNELGRYELTYTTLMNENQKELLEECYRIIVKRKYQVVGFNLKAFDIPTLRIKSLEENVDVPMCMFDSGMKPWELQGISLMDVIKGSFFYNFSLRNVCNILNIECLIKDIDINQLYHTKSYKQIKEQASEKLISIANVMLRLQGENVIMEAHDRSKNN